MLNFGASKPRVRGGPGPPGPPLDPHLKSYHLNRHTDRLDRQTDRQTQLKLLPTTYADGKNDVLSRPVHIICQEPTRNVAVVVVPLIYHFPVQFLKGCGLKCNANSIVVGH